MFGDRSPDPGFTCVAGQMEGLLRLAALDAAEGQVINIGNTNEITVLELAKKVITLTGSKSELSFHLLSEDDPLRRRPDITRAKEILGWVPKTPLKTGLARTIEWIRSVS